MRRPILLWGLLLIKCSGLCPQVFDENKFTAYTVNNGLSGNFVTGIKEDSTGFIWIATLRGLNRFDGSSFRQFLYNNPASPLVDNAIHAASLYDNDLLIATSGGAEILSTKTLERKILGIPGSPQLSYWSNATKYMGKDADGNIGIATKTGLYVYSKDGKLIGRIDRYTDKDIGTVWMNYGNYVNTLPDGNMLIRHIEGMVVFDRKTKKFVEAGEYLPWMKQKLPDLDYLRFYFLSPHEVLTVDFWTDEFELYNTSTGVKNVFKAPYKLMQEMNWRTTLVKLSNNTWAFTAAVNGIFLFTIDLNERKIQFDPKKYLKNYLCTDILMDAGGHLWVGTNKGLLMEKRSPGIIQSFPIAEHEAEKARMNNLLITKDRIYAGTRDETVLVIDKQSKKVLHRLLFDKKEGAPPTIPLSMLEITKDSLLVSTYCGLFWVDTRNYKSTQVFLPDSNKSIFGNHVLYRDRANHVWIGTSEINLIYRFNLKDHRFTRISDQLDPLLRINVVFTIAEDRKGNIWLAGDAIARWNTANQKIDTLMELLSTQKNRKKGYAVMQDSKGDIWTTLNDDGFARLTGSGAPAHYRPTNYGIDISGMVFPSMIDDKIFTSTNTGFGYFNTLSKQPVVFNESDGMPGTGIHCYLFYKDPEDESVWFTHHNTICRLAPIDKNYYTAAPRLLIGEISALNYKTISYPQSAVTLTHRQNDISVTMNVINFMDPSNMRYAYRFKNKKDSSWIDMGTQSSILLTNISPGNYHLQVKVYAFDNKWPEQIQETNIIIKPPFWKTNFFRIVALLLIAGIIYVLYTYRIRQINQRANLDRLLAQTEMKALHSQMNPHFIFNCLNSIKKMILENENQNASRYLSKFAQLIRDTLNQSTKTYVSLRHTIDHLQRYLEMEQIRSIHFSYAIETEKDVNPEEIFIPPMLIQPLIENAIWHGGGSPVRMMHIRIAFSVKEDNLICMVEDDGIGINTSLQQNQDRAGHQSLGIANTRQRIQVLNEKYNLRSTISIEDRSLQGKGETGTIATLCLPIKYAEL